MFLGWLFSMLFCVAVLRIQLLFFLVLVRIVFCVCLFEACSGFCVLAVFDVESYGEAFVL